MAVTQGTRRGLTDPERAAKIIADIPGADRHAAENELLRHAA